MAQTHKERSARRICRLVRMKFFVRYLDDWRWQPVARLRLRFRYRLLHSQKVATYRSHLVTILYDVIVKGAIRLLAPTSRVFITLVGAVVVVVVVVVVVLVVVNGGRYCGLRVLRSYLILALLNVVADGSAELTVIQTPVTTDLNLDIDRNNLTSFASLSPFRAQICITNRQIRDRSSRLPSKFVKNRSFTCLIANICSLLCRTPLRVKERLKTLHGVSIIFSTNTFDPLQAVFIKLYIYIQHRLPCT